MLTIGNYTITKPVIELLYKLQAELHYTKLNIIEEKGEEIRVQCPFHADGQEQHPSCYVNSITGIFHCFTCDKKGDFVAFVSGCLHISYDDAQEWIFNNCGIDYIQETSLFELPIEIATVITSEETFLDESVLTAFQDYHPYMTKRGLNEHTIKEFEIKYDPKSRCVVFPVRDINGKLKFLTRRSVDNKRFIIDKNATKSDIYLLHKAKKYKQVIICESQFNALTAWQYGYPAIALFGASCPKSEIDVLNKTDIRHWILMMDNDAAGRKGAEKLKKYLRRDRFITDIIMPEGKDVNDLSKEQFDKLLMEAGING